MFTVNGKELDYDIFDADKADYFEAVLNEVHKEIAGIDTDSDKSTWSGVVRKICEAIANAFNKLFGSGTAERVFDGTVNLKLAMKSFEELVDGVNAEKAEIESMAKAVTTKYAGNRTQRRSKK